MYVQETDSDEYTSDSGASTDTTDDEENYRAKEKVSNEEKIPPAKTETSQLRTTAPTSSCVTQKSKAPQPNRLPSDSNVELIAYVEDLFLPFDAVEDAKSAFLTEIIRGRVTAKTNVWVRLQPDAATLGSSTAPTFQLIDVRSPPPRPKPRDVVNIITNDEELIPVSYF